MRLIDADELKKRLMEMTRFKPNYEIGEPTMGLTRRTSFHMSEIMRVVIDMPTIEERKTGKWETEIISDVCGLKHAYYACSACGKASEDEFCFCPNCGAKMEDHDGEE